MNAGSKRLLATRYLKNENGNAIGMRDRYETTDRQWELTVVDDSIGMLTWVYSSTGKVITVSNESLIVSTNTQAATQKFTIERITSGDYCGLYTIKHGGKYVAVSSSGSRYPTLTTTFNEYAAWSFMAEDRGYADVFDFAYPAGEISNNPTNSTVYTNSFLTAAEDLEYLIDVDVDSAGNITNMNTNASAETAYDFMQSSTEIMVYRGHGSPGLLVFGDEDGLINGLLTAFDGFEYVMPVQGDATIYAIEALDENALAHMRCVIYNGCHTGDTITLGGTDYNLVDATFEKGAHYVLGVKGVLPVVYEEWWFELLTSYLADGYSIGDAVEAAVSDMDLLDWPMDDMWTEIAYIEFPYYALGDDDQFLAFD